MTRPLTTTILALALLALTGCAGKELSVALQTYTATMTELTAAREAGRISDETQTKIIAPAREATKAILDEAVAAYVAGEPFDWRLALRRAYHAMAPLLRQRQMLEATR
jgi:hypothetical protein